MRPLSPPIESSAALHPGSAALHCWLTWVAALWRGITIWAFNLTTLPLGRKPNPRTPMPQENNSPHMGKHPAIGDVPVFNCLIYVSRLETGAVRARVANLAGISCIAASEREAFSQLVAVFKQQVSEHVKSQTPIPWIEPPPPMQAGEQQRFLAVHL